MSQVEISKTQSSHCHTKEPSGALAQLLGVVVDSGRRFAQVADAKISDVNSQAPVGTTVALIEQGSKIIPHT